MRIVLNAQLISTDEGYRSAGVSQYSRNLVEALGKLANRSANRYHFSAFVSAGISELPGVELIHSGLLANGLRTDSPIERILWEQLCFASQARALEADLIHGLVNVLPLRSRIPGVVTVHDLSFLRFPKLFPRFRRSYLATLCRESVRRADQIICVSQQTADDLISFWDIPLSKITVIPNGVRKEFVPAPATNLCQFRQENGLPQRYLLYLGTLEPRKNVDVLLKAFARWKDKSPGGRNAIGLVVAGGKGWFTEELFDLVHALKLEDEVIFPGYVPQQELPNWYRAAEAFIYPSRFEGFGLPVLEAMACGVPVICSQIGSLMEIVDQAAVTVSPGDVEQLANAIDLICHQPDLRADKIERGFERVRLYSWKRTAVETAAVYESLVK